MEQDTYTWYQFFNRHYLDYKPRYIAIKHMFIWNEDTSVPKALEVYDMSCHKLVAHVLIYRRWRLKSVVSYSQTKCYYTEIDIIFWLIKCLPGLPIHDRIVDIKVKVRRMVNIHLIHGTWVCDWVLEGIQWSTKWFGNSKMHQFIVGKCVYHIPLTQRIPLIVKRIR